MRPAELQRFIEHRDGTECIAYMVRADGTMITAPRWPRLISTLQRARAGLAWTFALLLPSFVSGCAQRWTGPRNSPTAGVPLPGRPMPIEKKASLGTTGEMLLGEIRPRRPDP
jgi:hypothetical protein